MSYTGRRLSSGREVQTGGFMERVCDCCNVDLTPRATHDSDTAVKQRARMPRHLEVSKQWMGSKLWVGYPTRLPEQGHVGPVHLCEPCARKHMQALDVFLDMCKGGKSQ